jgi:hypothetical protein
MSIDAIAISEVDEKCLSWQQGDAFFGETLSFVHVADLSKPLTENAELEARAGYNPKESLTSIGTKVPGLVIISQTCDLIRSACDRPYVQVAALQTANEVLLRQVRRNMRPSLAFVPALEKSLLVANLDAIMTIEKSVLTGFSKDAFVRGLNDDAQIRDFAECISRRFTRFAFPDNFVAAVEPIQAYVKAKHDKQNDEGRMLRAVREIRVIATPAWDASNPNIEFLFVRRDEEPDTEKFYSGVASLVQNFDRPNSSEILRSELLPWPNFPPRHMSRVIGSILTTCPAPSF